MLQWLFNCAHADMMKNIGDLKGSQQADSVKEGLGGLGGGLGGGMDGLKKGF